MVYGKPQWDIRSSVDNKGVLAKLKKSSKS